MKKGITLIGMPGAGKSTIGKKLAKNLNWQFLDLDILIQKKTGQFPGEFIKENGEKEFLKLEEELALGLNLGETVFSPGGSIIYAQAAMAKLQSETAIFYLELSLKELKRRLGENPEQRGIVGFAKLGLESLFRQRNLLYRNYAEHIISCSGYGNREIIEKIKSLV